jgi:hypothetical protein
MRRRTGKYAAATADKKWPLPFPEAAICSLAKQQHKTELI